VWSWPNPSALVEGEQPGAPRVGTVDHRALADRSCLLVGEAGRADEKQGLALAGRSFASAAEFLEFHPAVLPGRRFQAVDLTAAGVLDFAAALAVFRAEQVAEDGGQAATCDPGWNEWMLAMARRSISCTRSSARSTLLLSEIANARKLATAASMASRKADEASSPRSFVLRLVEGLIVAPGRDSDAATIFKWTTSGHASRTRVQPTSDGDKVYLEALTKRPLGNERYRRSAGNLESRH
jgi:hypothetical protein